eukprot:COSAG02_NODE_17594_length_992_cov_14.101742_1_plen_48_part_10
MTHTKAIPTSQLAILSACDTGKPVDRLEMKHSYMTRGGGKSKKSEEEI